MKHIMIGLFILGLVSNNVLAKNLPSSSDIRELMLSNWEKIEDYEVDIKLSLNIPGFRMPSRKIHYLYKAPDKSKVEVKGFAIVPKQGIQPFFTFFNDSLSFRITADTVINNRPVFEVVINDTFMTRAAKIEFYVDQVNGNIYQAWVTHEGNEYFRLNSEYTEVNGISLPLKTDISMQFPPEFKNIQRLGKRPTEMKAFNDGWTDEWVKGTVKIAFSDYQVNRGIPDHIFEENEEDIIQD